MHAAFLGYVKMKGREPRVAEVMDLELLKGFLSHMKV
jgi:hypothetical protein